MIYIIKVVKIKSVAINYVENARVRTEILSQIFSITLH